MADILLKNVSVEFPIYNANARSVKHQFLRLGTGGLVSADANKHVVVRALDNISLHIKHGDRIALIGHNGAGKTTFLRLLAQIYEPTSGEIVVHGRVSSLLNIMHGIEAENTGYENIVARGVCLGLSKQEIEEKKEEIAAFIGLGDYLHMPIRTYSAGMQIRLAFGIATCIQPEILLIDEIFGAGDASFTEKAHHRMVTLLTQSSIVVFASHTDKLLSDFCNKGLVMQAGKMVFYGDIQAALTYYADHGA